MFECSERYPLFGYITPLSENLPLVGKILAPPLVIMTSLSQTIGKTQPPWPSIPSDTVDSRPVSDTIECNLLCVTRTIRASNVGKRIKVRNVGNEGRQNQKITNRQT